MGQAWDSEWSARVQLKQGESHSETPESRSKEGFKSIFQHCMSDSVKVLGACLRAGTGNQQPALSEATSLAQSRAFSCLVLLTG